MRWGWLAIALAAGACGGGSGGAGTAPADAGGGLDAGAADAGGADAGAGDAGPVDDCTGIVPTVPTAALTFDATSAPQELCTATVTDATGVIAAESHLGKPAGDAAQVTWHEFTASGTPSGSFGGGFALAPQAIGFLGLQSSPPSTNLQLADWNASGAVTNFAPVGSTTTAFVLANGFPSGAIVLGNTGNSISVQSFDATGNPVNSLTFVSNAAALAAAQDQTGPILAVLSSGQGVWIDLVAGTSGLPFNLGTASTAVARPLIGGGVAVRLGAHWTAVVNPANSIQLTPPTWLTDDSDFVVARGGKAYAVTTPGTNVVTLAVGQTTCGSITLPQVTSVTVGRDGTVIGSSGANGCTKIFRPKLLQ